MYKRSWGKSGQGVASEGEGVLQNHHGLPKGCWPLEKPERGKGILTTTQGGEDIKKKAPMKGGKKACRDPRKKDARYVGGSAHKGRLHQKGLEHGLKNGANWVTQVPS